MLQAILKQYEEGAILFVEAPATCYVASSNLDPEYIGLIPVHNGKYWAICLSPTARYSQVVSIQDKLGGNQLGFASFGLIDNEVRPVHLRNMDIKAGQTKAG